MNTDLEKVLSVFIGAHLWLYFALEIFLFLVSPWWNILSIQNIKRLQMFAVCRIKQTDGFVGYETRVGFGN